MPLNAHRPTAGTAVATAVLVGIFLAGCQPSESTDYQGYVEGDYVYMASSQAGQLTQLGASRGQVVAAGDPLFVLESQNEEDAVHQAESQLRSAQALLADLLTGKRPVEVDVSRAQLAQARADAEAARLQLERDEAQFKVDAISRQQLEQSRATSASDDAHVRELAAQVDVAQLPGREEQIKSARAQVEAARASLAQAEWKLSQKAVRALNGGFVFDTMYRVGEWVPAGSPVVTLLPPGNIKVRFFVPEARLPSFHLGDKVRLTCDGCAQPIAATVSYISDQAEYTPTNIYSNDTRAKLVFMIEARPQASEAAQLHPGQPMVVSPS